MLQCAANPAGLALSVVAIEGGGAQTRERQRPTLLPAWSVEIQKTLFLDPRRDFQDDGVCLTKNGLDC